MKSSNSLLSTPTAILIGAVVVSMSILVHGGVIKLGNLTAGQKPQAAQPAQQPQGVAPVAKTEADIIANLKAQAKSLNLDQGKFDKCLDSSEKESLVKTDLDDGSKVGVNGTPAFFVNGRLISGAVPFSEFKKIIEEELSGSAPSDTQRETVAVGNLPPKGQPGAKVTIIEFSDYQCPFCSRFYTQTEGQIIKEYVDTGKAVFYYRDFPLAQIHPGAQKGAEAARCAGDQNKYWEYHNLVFEKQQEIF